MDRRSFNRLAALVVAAWCGPRRASAADPIADRCAALEHELGGRLGLHCVDLGSGDAIGHRADERFPMCSSFKWLAAAALLARVDDGRERLDRRLRITHVDLFAWAPVTRERVGPAGMTLAELCEAAVSQSDNTATQLIVRETGGIDGWNRYVRSIGDATSRLDRGEPLLNQALPNDDRDTTTPAAMVADLRRLLLEDGLSPASRRRLTEWMLATKTSDHRLRAGLPADWRLADKTGTGDDGTGTIGDVGVYWPPAGPPIVVAVYVTRARQSAERQQAAIAEIGRMLRQRRMSGHSI